MSAINGWHLGERAIRQRLGLDKIPQTSRLFYSIEGEIPEQHGTFYSTRLQFLPVCIIDADGRPWSSILVAKDGEKEGGRGYIRYPKYDTLVIQAKLWEGDPFVGLVEMWEDRKDGHDLIAGIGVELSTRRRNKFAGKISNITRIAGEEGVVDIEVIVNEALGNCPKYITLRDLVPYRSSSSPKAIKSELNLPEGERLSSEAISLILESDTVFLGSMYIAPDHEASQYPSHVGINIRGGRAGFIRVKPSDGRTLVLPDFSGNRFMTSLGNIEATPLASLTFISFTTGDVLYITGHAKNLVGAEAQAVMPFQDTLTEVYVTGYSYLQSAFSFRLREGYVVEASPYSPPIKLLAEETGSHRPRLLSGKGDAQPMAQLTKIVIHSPTIATFEWESSVPIRIKPGQAVIMDFKPFLGTRRYQHMSPSKPSLVNDDFVRTWTVSNYIPDPEDNKTAGHVEHDSKDKAQVSETKFTLTMREKPGGTVTGVLFSIARKLAEFKPQALEDSRDLALNVGIVGVSGEFVLPSILPISINIPSKSMSHTKSQNETSGKVDLIQEVVVEGNETSTVTAGIESTSVDPRPKGKKKLFWFAGGIGITPFLAMLGVWNHFAPGQTPNQNPWDIEMIISTREPDVILSLVFAALGGTMIPSYLTIHVFTNPKTEPSYKPGEHGFTLHPGRISREFLQETERQSALIETESDIFVCGSDGYEKSLVGLLTELGVNSGRIMREGFAY